MAAPGERGAESQPGPKSQPRAGSEPPRPLFMYGSLRVVLVRDSLLGERPDLTTQTAVLHGFTRQSVRGFGYPFVVPADADAEVDGELLLGLRAADYVILDEYEDIAAGLYERVAVTVETPDGPVDAWVYSRGPAIPN